AGSRLAVIAVTGLVKEARVAAGTGVRAISGGGNAQHLAAQLERELARGARAVISFGIAGGLADDLPSGTWLVARAIVTRGARWRLPPAASVALTPEGKIKRAAVLASLARDPGQLPALLRIAVDARTAFRALSRGRRLLGLGLAYPDLGELLLDVP